MNQFKRCGECGRVYEISVDDYNPNSKKPRHCPDCYLVQKQGLSRGTRLSYSRIMMKVRPPRRPRRGRKTNPLVVA